MRSNLIMNEQGAQSAEGTSRGSSVAERGRFRFQR